MKSTARPRRRGERRQRGGQGAEGVSCGVVRDTDISLERRAMYTEPPHISFDDDALASPGEPHSSQAVELSGSLSTDPRMTSSSLLILSYDCLHPTAATSSLSG